jgi:hypothetical protein
MPFEQRMEEYLRQFDLETQIQLIQHALDHTIPKLKARRTMTERVKKYKESKNSEFTLNDNPVCPYCSHEEPDTLEINFGSDWEGNTEITCHRCGNNYFCARLVSVKYHSLKLDQNR